MSEQVGQEAIVTQQDREHLGAAEPGLSLPSAAVLSEQELAQVVGGGRKPGVSSGAGV
jgi:bacteriocin-like protein